MAEEGVQPQVAEEKDKVEAPQDGSPAASSVVTTEKDAGPADQPVKEDKYEIRVNSYKLVSALGVTAVHNEVAFYQNGTPLLAFNGNAFDKETGEFQYFAISPGHTLRIAAGSDPLEKVGMTVAASVTLAEVSREEFMEKLNAATAASAFINSNKIDYVIVGGLNYEAQNSNSAATSLIHAMGYEYPEAEFDHLWAPGSKRNLLPDDWSVDDASAKKVVETAATLAGVSITQSIKDEKNPRYTAPEDGNAFPNLFNPNETTVPYTKKGEEVRRAPGQSAFDLEENTPTPPAEPEKELTEEEKAKRLDDELKKDAEIETFTFINQLVTDATGLDEAALDKLYEENPKKFYEIAQEELEKTTGVLQTTTRRTWDEIDVLMAEKLGVPVDKLYDRPRDITDKAYEELEQAGALHHKRDNPHLRNEVEGRIKIELDDIARIEAEAAAEQAKDTPAKPEAEAASKGFTSAADNPIKTNQDLTSSFSGAAANKPSQSTPELGVEIKDPALATKVAQNNPAFRAMA